ncbi:MAG: hypothetical protein OXN97_23085 [Bryobacterales bacterium]|nr:hypothetical protein [Bryobacterales bacterium]
MAVAQYKMPPGLPARFSETKQGFASLQRLLGIPNRREWQAILHYDEVKVILQELKPNLRGLKSSARIVRSAVTYYGNPEGRRLQFGISFSFGQQPRPAFPDPNSTLTPSLEYQALTKYNPDLHASEPNDAVISKSLAGITDFLELPIDYYSPFKVSALVTWPDLRNDLIDWKNLDEDRQADVSTATFAVATVLDDIRFLKWAAEQVDQLEEEFGFALKHLDATSADALQPSAADVAKDGYERVLDNWGLVCDRIVDIASSLKSGIAHPEETNELVEAVHRLESLSEDVVAAGDARQRALLISDLLGVVAACAEEFDATWLAEIQDQVRAQWELAYATAKHADRTEIEIDVDRLAFSLRGEVQAWREAQNTVQECRGELASCLKAEHESLEAQLAADARELDLHSQMAAAMRNAQDEKLRVLQLIGPLQSGFDPAKDYSGELAKAVEPKRGTSAQAPRNSGPSRSNKTRGRKDGDGSGVVGATGRALHAGDRPPRGAADNGGLRAGKSPRSEGRKGRRSGHGVRDASGGGPGSRPGANAAATAMALERGRPPEGSIRCTWDQWLQMVGDPRHDQPIPAWSAGQVPPCLGGSQIPDPVSFATSLRSKLEGGLLVPVEDGLRRLADFMATDPKESRAPWKPVYEAILEYCLDGKLNSEDSQEIALPMIQRMLACGPTEAEYHTLVGAADQLTELAPSFRNVLWSLDVADLFVRNLKPDQSYVVPFLYKIRAYAADTTRDLPAKHRRKAESLGEFLDRSGVEPVSETADVRTALSHALQGKKMVIYTLHRSTAVTVREWIQAIEPDASIRLLDNKVWADSLTNPVRHADFCVMVKSAATHAVTEMISRVRNDAGKPLIVPPSKGVHGLMRAICDAVGILRAESLSLRIPQRLPA